jgi:hypothetical protein
MLYCTGTHKANANKVASCLLHLCLASAAAAAEASASVSLTGKVSHSRISHPDLPAS